MKSNSDLIHMLLSSPVEVHGNTERQINLSLTPKKTALVSRTADYTSGDQNLEKTMLDNEIASMDH